MKNRNLKVDTTDGDFIPFMGKLLLVVGCQSLIDWHFLNGSSELLEVALKGMAFARRRNIITL